MTIDSHQHFWKYNSNTHAWIDDQMSVLKKDFLPSELQNILIQNKIDACIAVQASQTEDETEFLHSLSLEYEFIKGVVGWVDLQSENVEERLEHYSGYNKIVGFRHIVQDEPDPNFMLQAIFKKGISKLKTYNFTYDILIYPSQLEASLELIKYFPNQKFVIDHLAKPYIRDGKINDWKNTMQKIARHQNVSCKLSGMVTEANWQTWKNDDFTPYLDVALNAFGANRLMYGSDWPVCLLAASYQKVIGIILKYIDKLSPSEKQNIMGLNALNFYNISNT